MPLGYSLLTVNVQLGTYEVRHAWLQGFFTRARTFEAAFLIHESFRVLNRVADGTLGHGNRSRSAGVLLCLDQYEYCPKTSTWKTVFFPASLPSNIV